MNLLIIDDDQNVLDLLKSQLNDEAEMIYSASTYDDARYLAMTHDFDVILCDQHLSDQEDKQGKNLICEIRKHKKNVPIIILTGLSELEITPWEILDCGGDDFIRKPHRKEELIARIKVAYRRSFACQHNASEVIEQNEVRVNMGTRTLFIHDEEIHINNNLFLILVKFMKNKDKILTYEDLIEDMWGSNALFSDKSMNSLRVAIHTLQQIFKNSSCRVRNVYSCGYIFEEKK